MAAADFRMSTPVGPRVLIAGRERDYFSGTGYLGLHNHPEVQQAAVEAIRRYGMATATSRGGFGEHAVYDEMEREARAFFHAERVIYYPSGYMSGVILAQGLRQRCERVFLDESAHYSLFDGARAAGLPVETFAHCDAASLKEALRGALRPGERPMLLTDGVFPISGEIAPLPEYRAVLEAYEGAWLCLDDAHATGVLGANGRGTLEHFGIEDAQALAGHTLSKGIGGFGGMIAGPLPLLDELQRGTRVYVGASPLPLPVAAAAARALALARDPVFRERLRENTARARAGMRSLGWDLPDSPVPILCLRARPEVDLAMLKERLFEQDLCVAHVTGYSSTPPGGALRVAISASHTTGQIDRLVETMRLILERLL